MSSAHGPTQSPIPNQPPSREIRKASPGLLAVGFVLLILGLLLFLYVKLYRPQQKQFVYEGRIERTPPTGPAESPASGNQPLPAKKQKQGTVSTIGPTNNHHANRRVTPELDPIQSKVKVISSDGSGLSATDDSAVRSSFLSPTPQAAIASSRENSASPTPQASPSEPATSQTPEIAKKAEKKNVLRRFFDWLAGLFKGKKTIPNNPPVILSVTLSNKSLEVHAECPAGMYLEACDVTASEVQVSILATDSDGDQLRLKPLAEVGRIFSNDGTHFTWDLKGVKPGIYSLKAIASDGKSESESRPVSLAVASCKCHLKPSPSPSPSPPPGVCPNILISCPNNAVPGQPVTLSANVTGGASNIAPTYNWVISAGNIISGQGTNAITVSTTDLTSQSITATLTIPEYGHCRASCVITISPTTNGIHTALFGTVRSPDGAGVGGALVVVFDEDGRNFSATTDNNGDFRIGNLRPGKYRVEVSVAGFSKQILTNVSVSSSLASGLDIPLRPIAMPTPTPGATSTPTPVATPTPTASATPSPTPGKKVKEQDQIKVDYPERFLKNVAGEITFELERVLREVVSSQTNIDGEVVVIDKPDPIPEATPDAPLHLSFGAEYDAYATVRLIPVGLSIISEPANLEQPLNEELVKWAWRLKPAENVGDEASFRFEVDVIWKLRGSLSDKVVVRRNVWRNNPFRVQIGPPSSVKAAAYSSPVLGAGGLVALGFGARRRRRLLVDDQDGQAATAEEELEEEVNSSVYAPSHASPGNSFLVQVFAHLAEQAEGLEEIAREADEDARRRTSALLQKTIKRGAVLTFNLAMPGLEIDTPVQSCVWSGKPAWVQFGVTVPKDCEAKDILGLVIVCENTVPIGHLRFKFKIDETASHASPAPVHVGNAGRYRQAFISYSSKDRSEVLKRVQMLNSLKLKFFQDLLTLEPGDQWEKLIYQYIDESDVFFLFWSKAASESPWVTKEIQYAMRRKGDNEEEAPEIVPVIIEGPPPAKPPSELNFLHFNDKFIYFINKTEAGS